MDASSRPQQHLSFSVFFYYLATSEIYTAPRTAPYSENHQFDYTSWADPPASTSFDNPLPPGSTANTQPFNLPPEVPATEPASLTASEIAQGSLAPALAHGPCTTASSSAGPETAPEREPSGPPVPDTPVVTAEGTDLIRKRQRNTLAARKYRQKRLDRICELENALQDVTRERDDLKLQLARQEAETAALGAMMQSRIWEKGSG